jgi:hypothetical protein
MALVDYFLSVSIAQINFFGPYMVARKNYSDHTIFFLPSSTIVRKNNSGHPSWSENLSRAIIFFPINVNYKL